MAVVAGLEGRLADPPGRASIEQVVPLQLSEGLPVGADRGRRELRLGRRYRGDGRRAGEPPRDGAGPVVTMANGVRNGGERVGEKCRGATKPL